MSSFDKGELTLLGYRRGRIFPGDYSPYGVAIYGAVLALIASVKTAPGAGPMSYSCCLHQACKPTSRLVY